MQSGELFTSGGRVLSVTTVADTLTEAVKNCYNNIGKIHFENMYYRKDIAKREILRQK